MTEEVQIPAEVTAPEQVETASPAPEVSSPEEKPTEQAKTFTQEELDAAIGKRLAREQRKWEREQAARLAEVQTKVQQPAASPSQEQFESVEAYAEALAAHKAEELLRNREQQRARQEIV